MSVKATSFQIYSELNGPFQNRLFKYGREGLRMVGSNPAMFYCDSGSSTTAAKMISGTVTAVSGGRVTFPAAFTYRCFGLSVQHVDDLSVNWDYNSGYHGGEVTVVYASGLYDASGFYLYGNLSYLSGVSEMSGNFTYCYTAWGI
jgi:hypothetical protein